MRLPTPLGYSNSLTTFCRRGGSGSEEVAKLMEVAEVPGTALASLFEEEVVPSAPAADVGDPEP